MPMCMLTRGVVVCCCCWCCHSIGWCCVISTGCGLSNFRLFESHSHGSSFLVHAKLTKECYTIQHTVNTHSLTQHTAGCTRSTNHNNNRNQIGQRPRRTQARNRCFRRC